MKNVIEKFIGKLIKELEEENNCLKYNNERNKLDIPYIVAPIYQNLSDDKYNEFLKDISKHEYDINYSKDSTGGYTNGEVIIMLYDSNENEILCDYRIEFAYNSGDDWDEPNFKIQKITYIGESIWNGNQDNYLEFECNFYKSSVELATKKKEQDKKDRIKYLIESIEKMQFELNDLR